MGGIIDACIKKTVVFHDVLHIFLVGRGMGKSIMELNIVQELASLDQDPLFLVLLDLIKSYDNLDRGRILKTLYEYGVGTKIQGMLAEFWER